MRRACCQGRLGAELSNFRKISCISALVASAIATLWAGQAAAETHDLVRAGLSQAGRDLIATIRTSRPVALGRLERQPRVGAARATYVCVELREVGGRGRRRLCLGGSRDAHRRVGLELVNAAGRITAKRTIAARVKRPSSRKLVLTLTPGSAGLSPRRYAWRVVASSGRCARTLRRGAAGSGVPPLPPATGARGRLHRRRRRPRSQRPARAQRRRPHLRRRPQRLHPRLPRRPAREARGRHLLRDRPGGPGAVLDDAAHPRRRQRDRQPHGASRLLPGLLGNRRCQLADRGR